MRKNTIIFIVFVLTLSFTFSCGKSKKSSPQKFTPGHSEQKTSFRTKRGSCSVDTPLCKCRKRRKLICSKSNCLRQLPLKNMRKGESIRSIVVRRQGNLTTISDDDLGSLSGLRTARFPSNGIDTIAMGAFASTPLLEVLDLHRNNLTFFPPATRSLSRLRRLNLGNNQIELIGDAAFESLRSLEHLILNRNKLKEMPKNLPRSLVKLSLSGNDLASVGDLLYLQNLKILRLDSNQFLTIDSHALPATLSELSMCNNMMTSSHSLSFENLTKLRRLRLAGNVGIKRISRHTFFLSKSPLNELDLRDCRISHIEPQSFSLLPNLQKVDLVGNQLTSYSPQWFVHNRRLVRLTLADNKWVCNCAFVLDISELETAVKKQIRKKRRKGGKRRNVKFVNDFERILCDRVGTDVSVASAPDGPPVKVNLTNIDRSSCERDRPKWRFEPKQVATAWSTTSMMLEREVSTATRGQTTPPTRRSGPTATKPATTTKQPTASSRLNKTKQTKSTTRSSVTTTKEQQTTTASEQSQEHERRCTEGGVDCQFPFEYNGKTYTDCVRKRWPSSSYWCYTNIKKWRYDDCTPC